MDIFRDISVSPFERRLARLATMLAMGDNLGGGGAKNAPPPSVNGVRLRALSGEG